MFSLFKAFLIQFFYFNIEFVFPMSFSDWTKNEHFFFVKNILHKLKLFISKMVTFVFSLNLNLHVENKSIQNSWNSILIQSFCKSLKTQKFKEISGIKRLCVLFHFLLVNFCVVVVFLNSLRHKEVRHKV